MKLLFIIDNLGTGGAQRQLINLAIGLVNLGHHIEFFCYSAGDALAQELIDSNIPIFWYKKQKRFSISVILQLRFIISNGKFDIVFSALNTPNFYSSIASFGIKKTRLVLSERNFDKPGYVSTITKLQRYFFIFSDYITMNSYSQKSVYVKKYPWLKNKISVIYNGYDLKKFIPPKEFHHNNPIRILVVSSVQRRKNGICLINALSILKEKHNIFPEVSWVGQHIQSGDHYVYLQLMKNAIIEKNLDYQWKWIFPTKNIIDYYHNHDVLILPSFIEGLPNVVCESMCCSLPVIVSNTLDHPRLVQDGESGFLFNYLDPNDLALKIIKFCELTKIERLRMGESGRKFAEKFLSLERYVNDYEKLFLGLID